MVIDSYCALGLDREYDLSVEALLRAVEQLLGVNPFRLLGAS